MFFLLIVMTTVLSAHGLDLDVARCRGDVLMCESRQVSGYKAVGQKWSFPEYGLCTVYVKDVVGAADSQYTLNVDLHDAKENMGQVGVMYNVQDTNNFDFVLIMSYKNKECKYASGAYVNGKMTFPGDKVKYHRCVKWFQPAPRTWIHVKVAVKPDENGPEVYLNGIKLQHLDPMVLPKKAHGGIVVVNTISGNTGYFDNFNIN